MAISPFRKVLIVASATWIAFAALAANAQAPVTGPSGGRREFSDTSRKNSGPTPLRAGAPKDASSRRLIRMRGVRSWGYQLQGLSVEAAAHSPYDLLVVDATTGTDGNRPLSSGDVARLQRKPDGGRRLVVSYLSIGEAEDYRSDYFSPEYMTEDAPDWLGRENPEWKGNRTVNFCHEGWQRSILGDDDGRSVYNSVEFSPLYRLIELGFDGVYLDRADVYREVSEACPQGAAGMTAFITRLAQHARRRSAEFLVILQNAEELVLNRDLLTVIDGIAKEDLFYGADHGQAENSRGMITSALRYLRLARSAGRPVLVVDYVQSPERIGAFVRRSRAEGFLPYVGPRDLSQLWVLGRDF